MDVNGWSNVIIAFISAVTGGGLLKVADTWLNRAKLKNETAKQLRDEAREEATSLKNEINYYKDRVREREKEIDDWRRQYWHIYEEYSNFKLTVSQLLINNGIDPQTLLKGKNES